MICETAVSNEAGIVAVARREILPLSSEMRVVFNASSMREANKHVIFISFMHKNINLCALSEAVCQLSFCEISPSSISSVI